MGPLRVLRNHAGGSSSAGQIAGTARPGSSKGHYTRDPAVCHKLTVGKALTATWRRGAHVVSAHHAIRAAAVAAPAAAIVTATTDTTLMTTEITRVWRERPIPQFGCVNEYLELLEKLARARLFRFERMTCSFCSERAKLNLAFRFSLYIFSYFLAPSDAGRRVSCSQPRGCGRR